MSVFILEDPYVEVIDGLWFGRGDSVANHDAVLSLFSPDFVRDGKCEHPTCTYLYVPMEDSKLIDEDALSMTSDFLGRWHKYMGRSVLVRCQAGLNRSGLVLGHYMVTRLDYSPVVAIGKLQDARGPDVLHNFYFRKYLLSLGWQ